ncbi:MAG: response regulator [Azospirillum sp.]|nr:response regulator [Azospirillum sp.]
MSIRNRFYWILATIAVLMVVLAFGSVFALRSSQTLVNQLFRNALQPTLDLKTVSDGYTAAGIVTAVRVRTGDLDWEDGERAVRHLRDGLKPAWADYLAHADASATGDLLDEAASRMVEADAALDELADILAGQDVAGLATYIARVMYPSLNPLLAVITRLAAQQDHAGQEIFDASNQVIRRQEHGLAIVLSIAAAAFVVAFSTILGRVVRPLVEMTQAMSAVASDNLDHPVPSTERADEIGALAQALARFRDNALELRASERRQRQLAVDLREARDKAEEATRAKSSFLAMMSHEIRTPMNGVMSMAELLDQSDLTDDQRSMSTVIRQSAAALLTIINDILDFSKIEAGKLEIERVPFSLLEVVEGTAELIAARTEERGLDLVVDADPALPDRLQGDPTRVRQVLLNLLGNAVKFTETGAVTLAVTGAAPGALDPPAGADDTLRLRFAITDTGIGITEEQRSRLFQAFSQADAATARKYGGTGLGLTICQRLCEMMGGAIGVSSVSGEGSTFWFELPLAIADGAPAAPEIAIADARVLAVGLPPAQAAVLGQLLAAAGITDIAWLEASDDVVDRLGDAAATTPAVVILCLTGADYRALAALRRLVVPAEQGVCRVLLVATRRAVAGLTEAERGFAFASLVLPLRRQRLWRMIAAALGRADLDQRRIGEGFGQWLPPSIEQARAVDAVVLVAEDNPTNQVVIKRLLDRLGYAHQIAGNGREALSVLEQGGFGLLLTDYHMPEMDGFQLTAAIRHAELSSGARLPIVALTADALAGTEEQCRDAGMDGYLTKPIDSAALAATLERLLPQAGPLRRLPEAGPASGLSGAGAVVSAIDPAVFDPDRLIDSFGTLDEEARAFLGSFLAAVPQMVEAIDEALGRNHPADARDAAHALKGAAHSIGAVRLGRLAGDLQDCLDADDIDTATLFAGLLRPTLDELSAATATLS